jgi:serine/threonine-protein kinase
VSETGGLPYSIGPYVIESVLAKGALGMLARARDDEHGIVALRILKPVLAIDHAYIGRLERQLERARSVVHPRLAAPVAWGSAEDEYLVASPFAEGTPLAEYRTDRPLGVDAAGVVLGDISSALAALHEADVVHEGISADKVIVGDDGHACLIGAGMISFGAYSMVTTRFDQVMGNVNYLPPEVIKGFEPGLPADVYALSCVAFECLSGEPPFDHRFVYEIALAHLERSAPHLAERADGLPRAWAEIVDAGLSSDPDDRPSARDFAAAFDVSDPAG